jgi:hypothetical protein
VKHWQTTLAILAALSASITLAADQPAHSSGLPVAARIAIGSEVDALIGDKHVKILKPENFIDYASLPEKAQEVISSSVRQSFRLISAYANQEYLDEYVERKLVRGAKLIQVMIDREAESVSVSQDEFTNLRPFLDKQAGSTEFGQSINEGLSPQLRQKIELGAPVHVDTISINDRAFAILLVEKISTRDVISDNYLVVCSIGYLRLNDRLAGVWIYAPFFGPESIAELRAVTTAYLGKLTSINQ